MPCVTTPNQKESSIVYRMHQAEKQTKIGTIESFFRSSSIKKRKIAQAVSTSDDLSRQTGPIESYASTTDQSCSLEFASGSPAPQLESLDILSSSTAEQCALSKLPAVILQCSSTPDDISHSGTDPPSQPKLAHYKKNKEKRSFQSQWYSSFPWLEYSEEQDCAFCFYCRHFSNHVHMQMRVSDLRYQQAICILPRFVLNGLVLRMNIHGSSFLLKNQSDSFVVGGFKNWKHSLTKGHGFQKHEVSIAHRQATANYQQYRSRSTNQTTVLDVLDRGRIEQIHKNRQRLLKIASALLFCARQMISIRGHDENERSVV